MSANQKLIVAGIITLAAVLISALRLQPSNDVSTMLPLHEPVVGEYFQVTEAFKTHESLFIDVDGSSLNDDELYRLYETADELFHRLQDSTLFARIQYRFNDEAMRELTDTFQAAYPVLLQESDYAEIESRLTEEGIRDAVAHVKRTLTTSISPAAADRLRRDPLGLVDIGLQHMGTLGNENPGARIVDGRILSADERHVLLIAIPGFPAFQTEQTEKLEAFMHQTRRELTKLEPSVTIRFAGGHLAHMDNEKVIRDDLKRTLPAMIIALLALSIAFFRHRFAILLVSAPITFGFGIALAFFSLVLPDIPGLVIGCSALLIGISIDYGIHVVMHLEDEGTHDTSHLRFRIFIAATTTTLAFLVLLSSSIEGQRQMGALAAIGIGASAWFAMYLLPAFAVRFPKRRRYIDLSRIAGRLLEIVERHRRFSVIMLLLGAAVAIGGLRHVRFDGDLESMNYLHDDHRVEENAVRDQWQRLVPSVIVLRGPSLQPVLEENDALYDQLQEWDYNGTIQHVSSMASLLPSQKKQQERWQQWQKRWTTDITLSLAISIREAGTAEGFTPSAFDPFVESLEREPVYLTLADYEAGTLGNVMQSRIRADGSEVLVQSTFHTNDLEEFSIVRKKILQQHPDAIVINGPWFAKHTSALVMGEMLQFAVGAGIVVVVCLLLFTRSIKYTIAILFPVIFGTLLTFGILGWINMPINFVNSLFIIYVFGVGTNFNVFLVYAKLDEYHTGRSEVGTSGAAVFLCAITTLAGFVALSLAQHPAIYSMGITGFVGIAACLVSSVLLVPVLLRTFISQVPPLSGTINTDPTKEIPLIPIASR